MTVTGMNCACGAPVTHVVRDNDTGDVDGMCQEHGRDAEAAGIAAGRNIECEPVSYDLDVPPTGTDPSEGEQR